jgi:hypothetical protein
MSYGPSNIMAVEASIKRQRSAKSFDLRESLVLEPSAQEVLSLCFAAIGPRMVA